MGWTRWKIPASTRLPCSATLRISSPLTISFALTKEASSYYRPFFSRWKFFSALIKEDRGDLSGGHVFPSGRLCFQIWMGMSIRMNSFCPTDNKSTFFRSLFSIFSTLPEYNYYKKAENLNYGWLSFQFYEENRATFLKFTDSEILW